MFSEHVRQFRDVRDRLIRTDLRPTDEVNKDFSTLVDMALQHPWLPDAVEPDEVDQCRNMCSRGESLLEKHWARRVIRSPHDVRRFPYRSNYHQLARYERRAVAHHTPSIRHWLFVGSGPLPLSVIDLAEQLPDVTFTCVDNDAGALELGKDVVESLGLSDRVQHKYGDAYDFDYSDFDVITIAALVGTDAEAKSELIEKVMESCHKDTTVAVRSVPPDGRRLLYPQFTQWPSQSHSHGEPPPPEGVVNSVIILHRSHLDLDEVGRFESAKTAESTSSI